LGVNGFGGVASIRFRIASRQTSFSDFGAFAMSPPSDEAEKTLYATIGHVTVNWAYVEIVLDFLVTIPKVSLEVSGPIEL
jgi:hypothetical protein